jgi:hypothetical protein
MDGLDFSILSDDQLTVLIKAACNEAVGRGAASAAAAYDAYQDARLKAERAAREESERIRQEAATRERDLEWRTRKGIAQEADRIFRGCRFSTKDLRVVAWQKGDDRRVFVQYGFDDTLFTYYVTGILKKDICPGHSTRRGGDAELAANHAQIAEFCKAVAQMYTTVNFCIGPALAYDGEAIPIGHGYVPKPLAGEAKVTP